MRELRVNPWVVLFATLAAARSMAAEPSPVASPPPTATPEQQTFFETRIRPLLANNCFTCHGPTKQEMGLRLDSRGSIVTGSENGPVVVPGDPEKSTLVAAVRHTGDVQMPPEKKLAENEIEALAAWIKQGLPWPEERKTAAGSRSGDELLAHARSNHWAFQMVRRPAIPDGTAGVKPAARLLAPIDRFIERRLAEQKLEPSPPADRRTLIRRATFDLVGLPPHPDDVASFDSDPAPDAFDRVVDRLLASPRYGERWGRHWLDVARYSDTRGYAFGRERRFAYAYTYRDYVIRAFNSDLPYDRFVLEQIAADHLDLAGDKRPLAALGLLTVGRHFDNQADDMDDRIDTVSRGFLGLTVSCARCHDHKYDPIPSEDYYSLYGVFASTIEPEDRPVIGEPLDAAAYKKYEQKLAALTKEKNEFVAQKHTEMIDVARRRVADYLKLIALHPPERTRNRADFMSLGAEDLRPKLVDRWRRYLERRGKPDDAVFGPWRRLLDVNEKELAAKGPQIVAELTEAANPLLKAALAKSPPKSRPEVAKIYGDLLADAYARRDEKNPPPGTDQLRAVLLADDSPTNIPRDDVRSFLNRADRNKFSELQKKIDSHQVQSPGGPPRAMSVVDAQRPFDPYVFVRGNQFRRGKPVPRQFLKVLAGPERKPFSKGSGRLELAQAIARPDNPLTARVMVNRVWMHHFGQPLVDSPSDFGLRSDPPTHPDLLDHLAAEFMARGWSVKDLHRAMVLSSTYQQTSAAATGSARAARAATVDPENRLLWRMNRRRLEFEALRDSLAAVAGMLDTRMQGPPADLMKQPYTTRRAVYGLIDRQDLPNLLRVFDFASPDQSAPRRPQTTVPQQALFLMNSPYVSQQAARVTSRSDFSSTADPLARITTIYNLAYGREPTSDEVQAALGFVQSSDSATAWPRYAQAILMSNEFLFVD
jgi:cytochrome c553